MCKYMLGDRVEHSMPTSYNTNHSKAADQTLWPPLSLTSWYATSGPVWPQLGMMSSPSRSGRYSQRSWPSGWNVCLSLTECLWEAHILYQPKREGFERGVRETDRIERGEGGGRERTETETGRGRERWREGWVGREAHESVWKKRVLITSLTENALQFVRTHW